ncbi:exodeoxyribonuclease V subunit gamma, partial [Tsukamurella soli]|uniref:exodeoxyribonuclease V subunit gamma n=1 Tax=Tsukamurella soli TaxID=644556 RepID=UPI0031EB60C6
MLTIHRAVRADVLVDALADVLAVPGDDAFAPEIVAVPARGVERWVTQRLAGRLGADRSGDPVRGDGIAANIAFPSPARLVAETLAEAAGISPDDDPWTGESLVWLVLAAADELAGEPAGAVLAHHLGRSDGGVQPGDGRATALAHRTGRRYATAELLTRLLRSYAANRPEMLVAWAAGRAVDGVPAGSDPAGASLDGDLAWQAELYRRVRERAGVPGPAERLADA